MPDAGHIALEALAADAAGLPPAAPPAGAACRAARRALGWSAERLAAAAGVSAGTVGRLERGVPAARAWAETLRRWLG